MKRCKSKSPVHDLRCELERNHTDNPRSLHKAKDIVWGNDGTHQHGVPLLDLLRRGMANLEFDTTPLAEAPIAKLFAEDRFASGQPSSYPYANHAALAAYGTVAPPGGRKGNEPTFMAVDEVKQHLAGRSTSAAHELAEWWRETAEAEIEQTVSKAVEYGATDLIDIGQSLARVAGREIDDATAAEWGIFFYLEGKLSRWRSAIERGDLPSFDTLLDIGVYARMAQRVRMTGGWPGTEDK